MKKSIIHEFDPVIYPVKIWIAITDDLNEVSEIFMDYDTKEGISPKFNDKLQAFIQPVARMSDGKIGFLSVFRSMKYCDTKTIAHEATHVARFIWDYLGETITGTEADAYLVGWIAECIEIAKKYKPNSKNAS